MPETERDHVERLAAPFAERASVALWPAANAAAQQSGSKST
jgi:hypothetical protein